MMPHIALQFIVYWECSGCTGLRGAVWLCGWENEPTAAHCSTACSTSQLQVTDTVVWAACGSHPRNYGPLDTGADIQQSRNGTHCVCRISISMRLVQIHPTLYTCAIY